MDVDSNAKSRKDAALSLYLFLLTLVVSYFGNPVSALKYFIIKSSAVAVNLWIGSIHLYAFENLWVFFPGTF